MHGQPAPLHTASAWTGFSTKCKSRWEACDIFSVNTAPGWDLRPCQLTCPWNGPGALYGQNNVL